MTDEQLDALVKARDDMLSWENICERVAKMKSPSFFGYGGGMGEPPEFTAPAHIFGAYKDKLTAWAQDGYDKAKAKYAAL